MKKYRIIAIIAVFLTVNVGSAPVRAQSAPMLSTFTNLSAEADPHTGSANFGIPIQAAPGRGGIEPNLGLQYNSSLPNGILGMGWNLETGSIRRSTKDGTPSYNNSTDTFVLIQNGSAQDLLYDSSAGFYRVKIEGAFMRVSFSNNTWTVRDRSGIEYIFGDANASREYNPGDPSKIFSWKLSKVTDLHGNTMTFTYTRDANVLYPQTIDYTANAGQSLSNFAKVEFTYESRSDDDAPKYHSGFLMNITKRIQKIEVKAADTLQRRYDFDYDQSTLTGRSLLTSVTQAGNDGTSTLPPVTFAYQNEDLNYNVVNLPPTFPSGDNLWVPRGAAGYDRGPSNYGPVPPYTTGSAGFAGLNWFAQQTPAAEGGWGPDGSWTTTPAGSLMINAKIDHAYHFSTYLYVDEATQVTVPYYPDDQVVGVWINGNYSQDAGQTWNLQAGVNLIDITVYHQYSNFAFYLNYALANHVDAMNSKAPVAPQLTGDFNADTFTDLARIDTTTGKLYVSLSDSGNFLPETEWLSGIGTNDKVVLGDYNSDGRVDAAIYRSSGSNWDMYFSDGDGFNSQGQWASNFGAGSNSQYAAMDHNGDGRPDLVVINLNGLSTEIAINTGTSFNPNIVADETIGAPPQTAALGDFNGDGLGDFIVYNKSTGQWIVRYNRGDQTYAVWVAAENFATGFDPLTADFNADGMTDIGYYKYDQGKIIYRRSNGSGFLTTNEELPVTFGITISNAQVTPVDLNGDTHLDIIVSNTTTGADEIAYSVSETPDLLSSAENGIGGETTIVYGTSHVCDCSFLPFPIQSVHSITVSDGTDSYTTFYEYQEAVWDAGDREFRGFSLARVIDPDGNYSETTYLTDDIYKGRPSEQRTYDANDNLFSKTVHAWDKQTISAGAEFVFLKRKDNYVYDGDATGRRTAETFFYAESPQYGNPTKAIQLGEVDLTTGDDIGADSRTIETTYVKNTASDKWILGLPNVTTVKEHDQDVVRKNWFYYDGSSDNNAVPVKGLLTKKTGDGPGASDPVTQYAYDAVGNLTSTTDPLGRVTSIAYDSTYKIFPMTTTNALSHQVINEYYGINGVSQNSGGYAGLWGQLKSTTDPNDKTGNKIYDAFGRPVASISPLDSIAYPTVITEYAAGSTWSSVNAKQRIESGQPETIDTFQIYDGLGRLSFNKSKSENAGTYVVSGRTQYNSRGLPEKQYLPRFTNDPYEAIDPSWPHTLTEYDAMGRAIEVTAPDGTYSSAVYNDWTTESIDPNGRKSASDYDAYGRLQTKREYTGADGRFSSVYPASEYSVYAVTQYQYDSEGNLVQTTDAQNNVTTITYDILGRKVAMNDPDMGVWTYEYDLNGNLVSQTDAKNQTIDFTYDPLNRLVNKTDHAGMDVDYTYDDVNTLNSKGRLSYVQYGAGNDQTAFQYDDLGRESASTKTVGSTNYDVLRAYDDLNRAASIEYPNGENIHYGYNAAGQIEQIANDSGLINEQDPWQDPEPDFLLHADGADGSTVFTDSSAFPKTVTANGNAQIDTAQSKFGSASGFFDGAGDYLSAPDSADWRLGGGTGDFTVDFWVRPAATGAMTYFAQYADNINFIHLSHNGTNLIFAARNAGAYEVSVSNPWTPSVNVWHHVAVVRSGDIFRMFINGSQIGADASSSGSIPDLAVSFYVGRGNAGVLYPDFNGHIDEFRVNPVALWTSNFDPEQ